MKQLRLDRGWAIRAMPETPAGARLAAFLGGLKRYDGDWPWWIRRQRSVHRNEPWPALYPKTFMRSCRDPVAQRRRGLRSGVVRRARVADRNERIVNLMRVAGRYSAGEIAEAEGVSRRTVWRVWRAAKRRASVARKVHQRKRLEAYRDAPSGCDTNPLKRPPTAKELARPPASPPSGQARSARFAALWRLRDEAAARQTE